MLAFVIFAMLVATSSASSSCYKEFDHRCSMKYKPSQKCNSKYGHFTALESDLQAYANAHIQTSFEYLLMSKYFGNYKVNRDGFKGLYRKLSDRAWESAIDLIKFIAQRGGTMKFGQLPHSTTTDNANSPVVELDEVRSLAKALEIEKKLAEEALSIHHTSQQFIRVKDASKDVNDLHQNTYDPSVAHYLNEKFVEEQAETIRLLAGHVTDLDSMLRGNSVPVSVFLFDEYLQKSL